MSGMKVSAVLKNPRWRRVLITIVVGGAWLVADALDPEGDAAGLFGVLALLWLAVLGFLAARWLWRKLTYRVGHGHPGSRRDVHHRERRHRSDLGRSGVRRGLPELAVHVGQAHRSCHVLVHVER
jgi:hypothetical protein